MKNILIIGGQGQVGTWLQNLDESFGFKATGLDLPEVNLTDINSIEKAFQEYRPELVINAAAYTAVDKAESDEALAYAVNDQGTENLGLISEKFNLPCFHISTDYVFDGHAGNYVEDSPTNPLSVYGKSKLQGELSLQKVCSKYLILRSCWIFSEYQNNFLKTMIRLGQTRDQLGIVSDQFGAPTSAKHVAEALLKLAQLQLNGQDVSGVYHFSALPYCNWFEFASYIFDHGVNLGLISKKPELKAITTADYPTAAVRPRDSRLNCQKITSLIKDLDISWEKEVLRVLKVLKENS
jgi:dTDP-4-dehydrorhamnose reductase